MRAAGACAAAAMPKAAHAHPSASVAGPIHVRVPRPLPARSASDACTAAAAHSRAPVRAGKYTRCVDSIEPNTNGSSRLTGSSANIASASVGSSIGPMMRVPTSTAAHPKIARR